MTRRTLTYILVSFGFSWTVALFIHLSGAMTVVTAWTTAVMFLYMLGPMVGALSCVFLYEKGRRAEALGLTQPRWRQLPLAWLSAILLLFGALLIFLLVPGHTLGSPIAGALAQVEALPEGPQRDLARAQLELPYMPWLIAGMSLVVGPMINSVLTLSEELGWRGYLWDQLRELGFWRATGLTGLLWGVWHMPIIWMGHNYPDAPIIGSVIFIGLCLLMSPLYSWFRIKSQSVWGPGVLHGTTNGAAAYFILWQDPMDMPWTGLVGIAGFIAAAISAAAVWLVWRRERPLL